VRVCVRMYMCTHTQLLLRVVLIHLEILGREPCAYVRARVRVCILCPLSFSCGGCYCSRCVDICILCVCVCASMSVYVCICLYILFWRVVLVCLECLD